MSGHHNSAEHFPKGALHAAGAFALGTVLLTAAWTFSGTPPLASPVLEREAANVRVVATRQLIFSDTSDGAVTVTDAATGATVEQIMPDPKRGFVRGVMRGMARERHMRGIGQAVPFTLSLWANGQLSLADPATGRTIELTAFGSDNRAEFMRFLNVERSL